MRADFLAGVLFGAGLSVVEHEGWEARGRGMLADINGIICHHTAGPPAPKGGATPSLNLVLNGRPDLAGPLSQLYLARDGTFHVLAAGKCNHAGAGHWRNISGNSTSLGIEAENAGDGHDPWPAVQMDAYAKGVAAILKHLGLTADDCCGHKEFALPKGRKIDPSFDMVAFREKVASFMAGATVANSAIVQSSDPRPDLKRGDKGPAVVKLQQRLATHGRSPSLTVDGVFGVATENALRKFQASEGLVADGVCGPLSWQALEV